MSDLRSRIIEAIRADGPMPVSLYMLMCLHDPQHGYYATRPAFNQDFTTAPETSQVFGELIGLWAAHEWLAMGKPSPFHLIELGPGRGVMMSDALRSGASVPGFSDAVRVSLVEASPALRKEQSTRLFQREVHHATDLDAVPPGPSIILANEFLDCLPIRQFVRGVEEWREKLVGIDEADQLALGLSAALPAPEDEVRPGAVREIAPALEALMYEIEQRLHAAPGRVLFIDYGYIAPEGADTLQALKRHTKVDPLEMPGEADLTAHVDFSRVAHLAHEAGLSVAGPTTQARFLAGLGVGVRADMLTRANPEHGPMVARQLRRLTHADEMGALFKVICLSSPNLPPPAGF